MRLGFVHVRENFNWHHERRLNLVSYNRLTKLEGADVDERERGKIKLNLNVTYFIQIILLRAAVLLLLTILVEFRVLNSTLSFSIFFGWLKKGGNEKLKSIRA